MVMSQSKLSGSYLGKKVHDNLNKLYRNTTKSPTHTKSSSDVCDRKLKKSSSKTSGFDEDEFPKVMSKKQNSMPLIENSETANNDLLKPSCSRNTKRSHSLTFKHSSSDSHQSSTLPNGRRSPSGIGKGTPARSRSLIVPGSEKPRYDVYDEDEVEDDEAELTLQNENVKVPACRQLSSESIQDRMPSPTPPKVVLTQSISKHMVRSQTVCTSNGHGQLLSDEYAGRRKSLSDSSSSSIVFRNKKLEPMNFDHLIDILSGNVLYTSLLENEIHYNFWDSLEFLDIHEKEHKDDNNVYSSLNRILEQVLYEIQENEKSGHAALDHHSLSHNFLVSYCMVTNSKPFIMLYRLLFEVYPGPPSGNLKFYNSLDLFNMHNTVMTLLDYWRRVREEDFDDIAMTIVWDTFVLNFDEKIPENVRILDMEIKHSDTGFQFMEMSLKSLAQQFTVIDHKHMAEISQSEFIDNAWQKHAGGVSKVRAPHILMNIVHFNNITNWASAMVLNVENEKEKAKIVSRLIRLARELHKIGNFNSLMAVHASLIGGIIHRFDKILNLLDYRVRILWTKLEQLMSANGNYQNYRKELLKFTDHGEYCIPFLGVILKDLAVISELPSKLNENKHLLNLQKIKYISNALYPLNRLLQLPCPKSDEDLNSFIHVMLTPRLTHDELMELSRIQAKESDNNESKLSNKATLTSVATSSNRAISMSALGGFQTELPDRFVVNFYAEQQRKHARSHISRMVEAIFKRHDIDGDGTISQEEFNGVLESFPFLDSFSMVDVDGDGEISYDEMNNYFLISCVAEMLFKRADADGNKTLSVEEFASIREEFPNINFEDVDSDGNGDIDINELRLYMLSHPKLVLSSQLI